jgi:hypothetical protein
MKNLFVSLFLILGVGLNTGFSQANVSVSKPYEVVDGNPKLYFQQGNELLKVTIRGKVVTIQKFNTNTLTEISKNEYENLPKGFQFEEIVKLNNRYYFFYSVWDRPSELEQLFAKEIDFGKGTLIPEEISILKVEGKVTGKPIIGISLWGFGVTSKFEFETNSDNTSLLIKYRKKPIEKRDSKNSDIIGFYVYTTDVKKPLWNREVTMPYTEALMDNLDYTVDKQGNAYLLAAVFDNDAKNRDDANFHLELFQLTPKSSKLAGIKIDLDGKSINKIWIYESPKGYMVCAGFYGTDSKYSSGASGIFALKVDASGRIYDKNAYDIPLEVLNQYASKREKRRNERKDDAGDSEFTNLVLRSITFQEDGSIILFGEQHFINVYRSNNRTVYEYHYNDLLLTKIDVNGKLSWMRKLPKKQVGYNGRGGLGYYSTSFEGKHYLLYLDNIKNLEISPDEVPATHQDGRGGFLISYVVDDKTGSVKKTSLFDSKDVEGQKIFQFNVDRIQQINGNEFVLEAYKKGKEDILIKVNLKK